MEEISGNLRLAPACSRAMVREKVQGNCKCADDHAIGAWQYDDRDIERLGMIMTLHGIGFDSREVETYMRLMLEGEDTQPQRIAMLNKKRGETLDEIHFKEKQISSMDYLRHEMQQGKVL